MPFARLVFRVHAIQRMYERRISEEDVRHLLTMGEVIKECPEDTPYPSRLVLGWCGNRPIHVVIADDTHAQETIVITVYEPDPSKWEADFRRKKA
jgi:hypothetical protein